MTEDSALVDLIRPIIGPVELVNTTWTSWRLDGLCAQSDPDHFFPELRGVSGARAAKRICGRCPATAECLEHALRTNEQFGVWGGTTEGERRRIRSSRRATAAAS